MVLLLKAGTDVRITWPNGGAVGTITSVMSWGYRVENGSSFWHVYPGPGSRETIEPAKIRAW